MLAVACVLAAATLIVVQVANLSDVLDVRSTLTAGFAKGLLLGYIVAVGAIVGTALIAPARFRPFSLYAAGAVAGMALASTLLVGGEAWSMGAALLTMAACWEVGERLLRAVGVPALAAIVPVSWLAGVAGLGLVVLAAGRLGLLEWWLVGLPVMAVGLGGAVRLGRSGGFAAVAQAFERVTSSRLSVGCAGLAVLSLGLASIWAAAPELMFDALYAKAWLPAEWARTGEITSLEIHPVLNVLGASQLIAVPGHLVGASGVGRYLQWLAAGALVASVWWGGRRSAYAPLAAAALALTPHLFWQATTAFDDALVALGAVGLALAIVRAVELMAGTPVAAGVAIGWLAGACVDLKLHLLLLAAGMSAGWWASARPRTISAVGGLAVGSFAAASAPFVLRWADTGNPVLPAWNNVFRSSAWPAVNEQFNFPYYPDPGAFGPLDVIWRAATDTLAVNEAAPTGAFGLLVAAIVIAVAIGWIGYLRPREGRRGAAALWLGLVLSVIGWYFQFRYLRYLLPAGCVAILVIVILAPGGAPTDRIQRRALVAAGVIAALLWPVTVAQFWNVPGRDMPIEAALGLRDQQDYERASMADRDMLAAFDRSAPPGARAVATAHQRTLLTDGRDLTPLWELNARLRAMGGAPTNPTDALERLRKLGIGWVLATGTTDVAADPTLSSLVARHGQLRYRDAVGSVYELVDRRRLPVPVDGCPTAPTSAGACWVGTLDRRLGYSFAEAPAGIAKHVSVCAGQTVVVRVVLARTSAPANLAIVFDGKGNLARTAFTVVPAGRSGEVAGPVPADARTATVNITGSPGTTVRRAAVGTLGRCSAE